jgi:hypothetical protein
MESQGMLRGFRVCVIFTQMVYEDRIDPADPIPSHPMPELSGARQLKEAAEPEKHRRKEADIAGRTREYCSSWKRRDSSLRPEPALHSRRICGAFSSLDRT